MDMKRVLFLLIMLSGSLHIFPQEPNWLKKLPQDGGNYYYRVTSAAAKTYKEAYAEAFAMAILESSWRAGVEVCKTDDLETIKNDVQAAIEFKPKNMVIPLNKVCEYEDKTVSPSRLYILWQVAKYGNIAPGFEYFNCD